MRHLAKLLMASALALAAPALAVTGCGSSSSGGGSDSGTDSKGGPDSATDSGTDGPGKDGGKDSSTDGPSSDTGGPCFPTFVIGLINNDTKPDLQPKAIPTPCADNPPGAAQNKEFNSLF